MKNKLLLTMLCFLISFGLTGCDVPLLPTSESIPPILQENKEKENMTESEKATDKKDENIINIEIDGQIKTESNSKEEVKEDESFQTKLVTKIITNLQEQNNYTTTLNLSYSGIFNDSIENIAPSNYKNSLTLSLIKDKDAEYKLSGKGNISSSGDIVYNNDYFVERYLDTNNSVFYQELINNECYWRRTGYNEDNLPKIGVNRNNLKTVLNESPVTDEGDYYIFNVNQTLEKAFSVIEIGGLDKIFNNYDLYNTNVTYQVYVNKSNYLINKIILRKSYNKLQTYLNHNYTFNLSKDFSYIEGAIHNTVLSNIDLIVDFDFKSENIYIDDSIIYESNNGRIVDKYDYKSELTKYDFISLYNDNSNIATFDCSENNTITCSGYMSGVSCDFYEFSKTEENYLGTLEIFSKERFFGRFNLNDFDKLEKEERENIVIYRFKNNDKYNYYILINENYGLVYSNKSQNVNIESLNKILKYMIYK